MTQRSLEDWLQLQQSAHTRGIDLSLERVRAVAQRLGLLPFAPRVVTVAGTNGKGSTVAYTAAILRALGKRVGAFTSPHLLRYNERIQLDGVQASDAQLVSAFERIQAALGDVTLTFFEYNTLAALLLFKDAAVDVAVLEVGLGGRLDAVNIIDADVAIVCSIGLDHRDWLGDTLEQIGREKAGIFRAGRPAILADPQMVAVVGEEAQRIGALAIRPPDDYQFTVLPGSHGTRWRFTKPGLTLDDLPAPPLAGDVQFGNAAAAIAAAVLLPGVPAVTRVAVVEALAGVKLPGRFQVIPGAVEWVLDVAHNEPAAKVLAATLAARPVAGRTYAVTGILADKDIDAIAHQLNAVVNEWILCGVDDERGLEPQELARRSSVFAAARLAPDVESGVRLAAELARSGDRVVVCGSFMTVAPALRALDLDI